MPSQKSLRKLLSSWPALKLTLPLLALMLTACVSKSPTMPADCAKVAPPAMPELPEQARQVPIPEYLPNYTAWLTKQRSEWQKLLNNQEFAASPVSEHTTKQGLPDSKIRSPWAKPDTVTGAYSLQGWR